MAPNRHTMPLSLAGAALLWCVGVGYWLWVTPIQVRSVDRVASATWTSQDPNQPLVVEAPTTVVRQRSFSDLSGPTPLVLPIVLGGLAFLAVALQRSGVAGVLAVLLLLFAFLTGFSIGQWYLPAALALLAAWVMTPRPTPSSPTS